MESSNDPEIKSNRSSVYEFNPLDIVDNPMLPVLKKFEQRKKIAAADLDVHVVKFVYETPTLILRIIWIAFMLLGLAFCAYYVAVQVISYQNNPTATKVSIVRSNLYEYPSIILCTAYNWDLEKARMDNLSHNAQVYAVTLIRNPFFYKHLTKTANISLGEIELHEFLQKKGFDKYADFYKWISLDSESFIVDDESVKSRKLEKVLIPTPYYDDLMVYSRLCHKIDPNPYFPGGPSFQFTYDIIESDGGFGFKGDAIAIKEDPRLILQKEAIELRKNRLTALRLLATKYIRIPNEKCVSDSTIDGQPYSKEYCRHECYTEAVKSCMGCTLLTADTSISESSPICSWEYHKRLDITCNETVTDRLKRCYSKCKRKCQYLSFQYMLQSQDRLNKSVDETSLVSFSVDYRVDQGLTTYEEVVTFTIDTLISEIGGQMGLWIGASVLFIFELLILLGQRICWRKKEDGEN